MNYLHLTRAQLSQEVYEEDVEVGGGLADAVVASRQWTVQSIEHSAQDLQAGGALAMMIAELGIRP